MNASATITTATTAVLPATCLLVIADDKTGALTLMETSAGQDFRTLCHDLVGGHIPVGHVLHSVKHLDEASGGIIDVTVSILRETAFILDNRGWSASRTLHAAYERHGLPIPSDPSDDPDAALTGSSRARGERVARSLYGETEAA